MGDNVLHAPPSVNDTVVRSRVRPTRSAGSGNVPGDDGRRCRTGIYRRPRARRRCGACGRHSPRSERRHRAARSAVGRSGRDHHRRRGARGREVQDAGRDLRHRRLRPRRARALLGPGPAGALREDAGRRRSEAGGGDPVSALGRQGRRGPRGAGLRPGAGAARERSGGGDGAARRAFPHRRQGAGRQVPGRVPGARREDGGRGLRGPPARRAEGTTQPLRRHDLPARARPQERAGRPARSLRRALGGAGPLRDVRSEAAARSWA